MLKAPRIYTILGVLVLAAVWLWVLTSPVGSSWIDDDGVVSESHHKSAAAAGAFGNKTSEEQVVSSNDQEGATNSLPVTSDTEIKTWVEAEAKNLEASLSNPDFKKVELIERVKALTTEQKTELKHIALNSVLAANTRIFASYAISLSSDAADLYDMATAKMPTYENVQPHSADEVKRAQEYALRYMQIDELASQALKNDKSLELLRKISSEAEDSQIRVYAERKLSEIKR